MGYNKKYSAYRPTEKEFSEQMRKHRDLNREKTKKNVSEGWMLGFLNDLRKTHGIKFKEQFMRGTRIFDFRCQSLGVAVEVDGGYHSERWKREKDSKYDNYNLQRSGIIVIRVKPFDTGDIYECIETIKKLEPWEVRRVKMGIKTVGVAKEKADKFIQKEKEMQAMRESICD